MLINLFNELRVAKIPVSLRELLDLINALKHHLVFADMEEFYYLARSILVKDERHFDKFDRTFTTYFAGINQVNTKTLCAAIPNEWLRKELDKHLTDEEKAHIQALGGLDKLIETLKQRLEEQTARHQGGNKWIGTGGTSPFGSGGYNPEGIRIGNTGERQGRAVKVWEKREYQNLDDQIEISNRTMKLALRRLRKFARTGASEVLDIDHTIDATAKDAGLLNIQMKPERHNAVKLLLLFDIGGSMDMYIEMCQELFSACRSEFKYLEYFYFHNFIYENVWQDNQRRHTNRTPTWDILHKYGSDYKVIFVGDASMGPYEINHQGGSVEHYNEEPGSVWMQRFIEHYRKIIWLNPFPQQSWKYTRSIDIVRNLINNQMYPLTLEGLEAGISYLSK